MFRVYVIGFVLVLCGGMLFAQQKIKPAIVYKLSEQNGLSDNEATCFYMDSRGLMWIGTRYGLNCFDGSSVKQYHGKGLPSEVIKGIQEDDKHRLWMVTSNGLCSYDPERQQFNNYPLPADLPGNGHFMEDLCIQDGVIYTAGEAGLISFKPGTKEYKYYPAKVFVNGKATRISAMTVVAGPEHDLWIGTYQGLWHFDTRSGQPDQQIQEQDSALKGLVISLNIDHEGVLWVGTWSMGLRSVDLASKKVTTYPAAPSNIRKIVEQQLPDGSYKLWLTAYLSEYDREIKQFKPRLDELLPEQRDRVTISKLYSTKGGLLWIGTERGVYVYDASKQYFTHYLFGDKSISSQGVAYCATTADLYMGGTGDMALGLYDTGFKRIEDLSGKINGYGGKKQNRTVLSARQRNDTLFMGTDQGLILYGLRLGVLSMCRASNKRQTAEFTTTVELGKGSNVYFSSWRNGFWKLNLSTGGITAMDSNGNYSQIKEDGYGHIWLADMTLGLTEYDSEEKKVKKVKIKGLPDDYVLPNLILRDDTIWGSTEVGVFAVDVRTKASKVWPSPRGMDKERSDFAMDGAENIWIASKNGLIVFRKQDRRFVKYLEGDGLLSNYMNGSLGETPDGRMVYGADNYLSVFDPQMIKWEDSAAQLYLEEVRVNGIPVDHVEDLHLKYNDKNISFSWALLHYDKPFQTQYYCKLDGVDEQWRSVGAIGYIQYNSLPPGTYTFSYRAVSPSGVASATARMKLSISPPFWKRWWFVLLAAAIAIAIVYLIYRYRLEQALKLERLRMKISTDLHDDIGSTLSSISILSDVAMREPDKQQAEDMLHEIKENSLELMDKMDDIVWSINPKNDSLEQLLLRMKRLASKVFEAKDISYAIEIHDAVKEVHLPMQYRQHIYLIIKEGINNIVKHSGATRAVIDVRYEKNVLEVVIRDNGNGFDTLAQSTGNGLISMRERAKMPDAKLDLESKANEGTSIRLLVRIA